MKQDQAVNSDGRADVKDTLTSQTLKNKIGTKINRYPDNQFIYRSYVQKAFGSEEE
jgi:hypothetical protein